MSLVLREGLMDIYPFSSLLFQTWLENRPTLVELMSYEMHLDLAVNKHTG